MLTEQTGKENGGERGGGGGGGPWLVRLNYTFRQRYFAHSFSVMNLLACVRKGISNCMYKLILEHVLSLES